MREKLVGVFVIVFLLVVSFHAYAKVLGFVDMPDEEIIVEQPFKRIISLYGAHTENLFSLGLDREIIGVSKNEVYPPQAIKKPTFSYHDDAEKFIAAHPDLIIIRPMIARGYRNLVIKLQKAGITVISLQPTTVSEMFLYWKKLGMLTGKKRQAEEMIERFQQGLSWINLYVEAIPFTERKRVYFEAIHSKMKTFSPSSIAIFALKSAGGINVADDAKAVRGTNIATYGKERILSHANEIDVYLAQRGTMNHTMVESILQEGGFKAIKAVRDREVYIIDEEIVSRPTMRLLEGIHQISKLLYADRFVDCNN
ncbi:MAG: ABC transporter substrate-binding protein [Thermodesulfobacteriota bacterium]|nr:ABC transporter substrate-binding protein [Thermodesulfobacteriota bacterium]